ncbi:hypothetical protein BL243_24845 [Ralstonia solanacearum]|nr:hypothetical protein BL243_24845 [Ralstonia solanacearum]
MTGRENPIKVRWTPADRRLFYVHMPSRALLFYGGPGGAALGLAGGLLCRFLTPAVWPATLM